MSQLIGTLVPSRPLPVPDAASRPFWAAAARGDLSLPRCARCNLLHWPPPPRCSRCLSDTLTWEVLSGAGHLLGWTTIHLASIPGVPPPFTIGEVELIEQPGLVLSALIVQATTSAFAIGQAMRVRFSPSTVEGIAYPEFEMAPP
jgi:uncharacterized OB-fold protein